MKDNYQKLRPLALKLMKILFSPTIECQEKIEANSKFILAGNHISDFDPLLLSMVTDNNMHFLAKKELFRGIFKNFFESLGCIPVDRDGKDFEAMKQAINYLKEEEIVSIFPEGTRKKKDDERIILPFKLGTVIIAKRGKAPIVPFAITGNYSLVKRNLKLTIGKRIDSDQYTTKDLLEKVEDDVKTLILKNK